MAKRKPWYFTPQQWADVQEQDARWASESVAQRAAALSRPVVPPGIGEVVWARMTEVERAQAWQSWQQHQAVLDSQARTRTTLVMIFVVVPVAILVITLVVLASSH